MSKPLRRARFLEYFVNRAPCLIGMEVCDGARQLKRLGHEMKLLPGRSVKAFNLRNKNDAATHRRSGGRWLKFRTMRINGLRDLLAEYGEVMSARRAGFTKTSEILARLSGSLPAAVAAMGARRRSARAGSSPLQAGQQGILGMCSIHLRGRCAGRDWRGDSETAPVASGPETDETSASLP